MGFWVVPFTLCLLLLLFLVLLFCVRG